MSTNKPRIQAYVDISLHQQFEQERSQWGISQSQALERILSERYQSTNNAVQFKQKAKEDYDLSWIKVSLGNIRERLTRLEIANNLDDDIAIELDSDLPILSYLKSVSELDSNLPGESGLVTSELDSNLPGESGLVTSELDSSLPSESGLVTSELDSSLPSESGSVTGELNSSLPGESGLVTSELNSSLPGESGLVTSELDGDLPSESGLVTSELNGNLPGELPQAELEKFVICQIDKQLDRYSFWAGNGRGFVGLLELAKRYKSENTIERPMQNILDDPDYSRFREEPSHYELRYNPVRFFLKNPKPKGKILANV